MMLSDLDKKIVYDIICEPVHGKEFYTAEMFEELCAKVESILSSLNVENLSTPEKIDAINKYMMDHVKVRNEYFDAFREAIPMIPEDELIYRTAYAALIKGEAMCAGYDEASRILLELSGLKTKTLLSKLPGRNKQLLHYVTCIEYDRGSGRDHYIMDPEREKSCSSKGFDFRRYLMEMTYILPEEYFFSNKVGTRGVGPIADEYLEQQKPLYVKSKNEVDKLFNFKGNEKNDGD